MTRPGCSCGREAPILTGNGIPSTYICPHFYVHSLLGTPSPSQFNWLFNSASLNVTFLSTVATCPLGEAYTMLKTPALGLES